MNASLAANENRKTVIMMLNIGNSAQDWTRVTQFMWVVARRPPGVGARSEAHQLAQRDLNH